MSARNVSARLADNPSRRRFELALESGHVAFIDYYPREDGALVLTHAEVPEALRGAGVGAQLATATFQLLRERGQKMVPRCPYLAQFLHRHPAWADLLAS